jgi:hypothetical protein
MLIHRFHYNIFLMIFVSRGQHDALIKKNKRLLIRVDAYGCK